MITIRLFFVGFVVFVHLEQTKCQTGPPPFPHLGCPHNIHLLDCPQQETSCVPTPKHFPYQFQHRHRGTIYRKIRARSWWFCGMACDPTTPCKFWTFRHATRECYLMKTCCLSIGQNVAGFQSGKAGACPNLEGTTTAALGGGDWWTWKKIKAKN